MSSQFETYTIYSGINDEEQKKKVLGAFNGNLGNIVEGAIVFVISWKKAFKKMGNPNINTS